MFPPFATATRRSRPPHQSPRQHFRRNGIDDNEWGVPSHDDRHLFEMLLLEGAQAGLSWSTILAKRENYRRALDGFDAERIARYDERKLAASLADPGIARNRLVDRRAIQDARHLGQGRWWRVG